MGLIPIKLNTSDGVGIAADYYEADGCDGIVLAHMMPADRRSWRVFAERLQKGGFRVVAIDLRGHGESAGGPVGYKNFSDREHQASVCDLAAAAHFF